jgi:hypothetical protein
MGTADLDFWSKEWPVITGAPHLFFGGILIIIVPAIVVIWFLFRAIMPYLTIWSGRA